MFEDQPHWFLSVFVYLSFSLIIPLDRRMNPCLYCALIVRSWTRWGCPVSVDLCWMKTAPAWILRSFSRPCRKIQSSWFWRRDKVGLQLRYEATSEAELRCCYNTLDGTVGQLTVVFGLLTVGIMWFCGLNILKSDGRQAQSELTFFRFILVLANPVAGGGDSQVHNW